MQRGCRRGGLPSGALLAGAAGHPRGLFLLQAQNAAECYRSQERAKPGLCCCAAGASGTCARLRLAAAALCQVAEVPRRGSTRDAAGGRGELALLAQMLCRGGSAGAPSFRQRRSAGAGALAAARASCRCSACSPPAWQALASLTCGLDGEFWPSLLIY